MYSSAFYKMEARKRLHGCYHNVVIGTLIYMIPMYVATLLKFVLSEINPNFIISDGIIDIVINIFVLNIFTVGYFRFLMNTDGESVSERGSDLNLVISGFTHNFKNTFKITFLRDLYLLGWGIVALIPMLIYVGIIAYLYATSGTITGFYEMSVQFMTSPTTEMAANLYNYVSDNCSFLPYLSIAVMISSIFTCIPLIRKTFEYAVIPMIVADNPDMTAKAAFKRSTDIMHGYRKRYFMIQLSFLHFQILASILFAMTASTIVYYICNVFLTPYIYCTLMQLYIERKNTVEHNTQVYGETNEW